MLTLSIPHQELVQAASQARVDAVELRLDLFEALDLDFLEQYLRTSPQPVLLTLRKASQGGGFEGSEQAREALIEQLLQLEPPYFDLEADMRAAFIHDVCHRYPKTQFVLSTHSFHTAAFDWEAMRSYPVSHYKIAAMTHSTLDALKLLLFAKSHPKTSVICMGEHGQFARVLNPIFCTGLNYACLDAQQKTGPGQLTVSELIDIYNYPLLNPNTAIYGLIGDPVDKSRGHLYHNGVFRRRNCNAVYVKMRVQPEELAEFIPLAKAIGIRGLSVTLPLKEKIVPFLDEIEPSAQSIGAVNTLRFTGDRIIGTNTDGLGALDAIEQKMPVRGKKVVLLGAGGAARAIAFEARERGADVLILNRTVARAEEVAAEFGCSAGALHEVPSHYDILINCSPDPMPIDPAHILPNTLAMDVVYVPRETEFLQAAARVGCQIVYGEEMFLNQAARQTAFWIGP